MKYILPIAGDGTRFSKCGILQPKPAIIVRGVPMLLRSMQGLPIQKSDEVIFVSQRKHQLPLILSSQIEESYPQIKTSWVEIDGPTDGQLQTVLRAQELLSAEDQIVIHNCDSYFESGLQSVFNLEFVDGAMTCFEVEGEHWSFARVDENDVVLETKEKVKISNWASVGLYYFRRAEQFVSFAERHIANSNPVQEYYVAPLYNDFIKDKLNIILDRARIFKPMGTPEDLKVFWDLTLDQLKRENGI